MKSKKIQIVISTIVFLVFVISMYFMRKDKEFESRHSQGILRNLYKDSLENKILNVDYFLRSDHIILDNKYEYFMTNASVRGNESLRGVLMDWINPEDSIYKNANENWFVVKESSGKQLVVYFE